MIIVLIFHKVFWTLISFSLFYCLFSKFVLAKIKNQINLKNKMINEILNEIDFKENKIKDIASKTQNINETEIPKDKNDYIEEKINFLLNEHKIKLEDEANFLANKLKRQTSINFDLSKIDFQKDFKNLVERLKK